MLTVLPLRSDKDNLQSDENSVLKHVMVKSGKLLNKFKCQQGKERVTKNQDGERTCGMWTVKMGE